MSHRVTATSINGHVGRSAALVGRVVSFSGSYAIVEAADGGQVNVALLPGSAIDTDGVVVEIVGVVNHDFSITEQASSKFESNDYDTNAYLRFLAIAEKYSDVI
ncbi:hypothetical protein HK100_006261 [Physocladia obscura]|uniref:Replication factor A protein 3 n=1 Tax=Physocladia obscura TaxID=109957 RepID=A0AAD5SWB3_9FUNG|nr:hypothetical protein HK100_006261 [Physocladia obscura]